MKIPPSADPNNRPRGWMWFGSMVVVCAAAILLGAAFYRVVSSPLLILVLIALALAIALHARFLILAHREHRETETALDTTEREFQSVFHNALDGIVIFDDRGICLDLNPAAQTLFGARYDELGGQPIPLFHPAGAHSPAAWAAFLERKSEHGETKLLRQDGSALCVEYTAKADYLPGRHVAILRDISRRKEIEEALRGSEARFQQMAGNIQEIFWMLDVETKRVIYVNKAYETITGRPAHLLYENPAAYRELIHPEDRARVLSRLGETQLSEELDEEFRIVKPDGAIRWVWLRGFPVREPGRIVTRFVGTVQDVSARKSAEAQIARNLDLAESARAEADAFRRTTLALTQNLSMDYVLDTLLGSLLNLIPCDSARVLLLEAETLFFVAREMQTTGANRRPAKYPQTFDATHNRFLMQVLTTKNAVLLSDTNGEVDWHSFAGHGHFRSWLCVPLVASQRVLGLLSLGCAQSQAFSHEHLRLAKSLAIPAAVAIQNARLYERAEIYGAELEQQVGDLQQTRKALQQAEQGRARSEERFTKVFRSSPIAFSITTRDEGRFVDVNEAFERRYGYRRQDLIGRTIFEIGIWDDPGERQGTIDEIREHGIVRNRTTRFRKSSGELIDTIYSAEIIELDGQPCLLAVSEDLPEHLLLPASLARSSLPAR